MKYEYKTYELYIRVSDFEKLLTQCGDDGWDLAHMERKAGISLNHYYLVFKRVKPADLSLGTRSFPNKLRDFKMEFLDEESEDI